MISDADSTNNQYNVRSKLASEIYILNFKFFLCIKQRTGNSIDNSIYYSIDKSGFIAYNVLVLTAP